MKPIDVTHRVGVSSFHADDWSLRYLLGCSCGDLVGRYRDEITAWADGRAHLLDHNVTVDEFTFPVFPEVAAALKRRSTPTKR